MEEDLSDTASEEQSDPESEHGETTDYEEEVVSYWHRLQEGVIAYPASLQTQCLLYIIGHLREIPASMLSLLPRSIRYKLLLHLPAVDVCQLNDTPVTSGIEMDEVWEKLYNERLPVDNDEMGLDKTPKATLVNAGIECSWKDIYFDAIFILIVERKTDECSLCVYPHFLSDLLFSIYQFNEPMELFDCFSCHNRSAHNVYRAAHKCPRFTPQCYMDEYDDPGIPFRSNCGHPQHIVDNISRLIDLLLNTCHFSPKHMIISGSRLYEFWDAIEEDSLQEQVVPFLSSLEAINVGRSRYSDTRVTSLFEFLFKEVHPHLKAVVMSHHLRIVVPYLISSKECKLKKFYVVSESNTVDLVSKVLRHHQELEDVWIVLQLHDTDSQFSSVIQAASELFYYPTIKEVSLDIDDRTLCTKYVIQTILQHFFMSPYPVSLTLKMKCCEFSPLPEPLEVNTEQHSKSLYLHDSLFPPEFLSLLPRNLSLRSLELARNNRDTLISFTELDSINLSETFSLIMQTLNMRALSALFRIVTAKEWDLDLSFDDASTDDILAFTSLISNMRGRLKKLAIEYDSKNDDSAALSQVISLLEVVFRSVSATDPPYFELVLLISENIDHIKDVHDAWKKAGSIKLKSLSIDSGCPPEDIKDIMSDMTLELQFEIL